MASGFVSIIISRGNNALCVDNTKYLAMAESLRKSRILLLVCVFDDVRMSLVPAKSKNQLSSFCRKFFPPYWQLEGGPFCQPYFESLCGALNSLYLLSSWMILWGYNKRSCYFESSYVIFAILMEIRSQYCVFFSQFNLRLTRPDFISSCICQFVKIL